MFSPPFPPSLTLIPKLCSCLAAANPAGPAPIMMTDFFTKRKKRNKNPIRAMKKNVLEGANCQTMLVHLYFFVVPFVERYFPKEHNSTCRKSSTPSSFLPSRGTVVDILFPEEMHNLQKSHFITFRAIV